MKSVFIRTDASVSAGLGHLSRCQSLGRAMQLLGYSVTICFNDDTSFAEDYLANDNFNIINYSFHEHQEKDCQLLCEIIHKSNTSGDILIVDSYMLNVEWEVAFKEEFPECFVGVIDDLPNRPHSCDVIIDYNYSNDYKSKISNYKLSNL